jgi:predicted nucleic acid-binding protein
MCAAERINIAIVLDAWAWVHYWQGDLRVHPFIEGTEQLITSVITIAELERHNTDNLAKMDAMLLEIQQRSRIVPIDISIARLAGNIRSQMKAGGIADALIIATAMKNHAKILTGDPHFKNFPDVIFMDDT